ncbi:MAG: FAD-binding domain-containing protein [Bacteroidota bacterium]
MAQGISYGEFPQNGIQRGKQNRIGWEDHLEQQYFIGATEKIELTQLKTVQLPDALLQRLSHNELPTTITTYRYPFQRGGETYAWQYFKSFLQQRYKNYSRSLSKPDRSRKSCSRLSPYLAFGCISSREVYQNISVVGEAITSDWNIKNFRSRLWWRSHYLQKLESWWRVEMQPINPAFNKLDRQIGGPLFEAWAEGRTGFPMVDASMRCLQATGWINFRMRAMLVTFASFALWLDWRPVAAHLARLFLDYDPGIHYPQIQMQAGLTGYHTLRIFNPTVQVREHDANGNFILQWLPELSQIPKPHLAEPWKMTSMEQTFYEFEIGKDYPAPIVDYDKAVAANKDRYWAIRQNPEARRHLPAIWQRFCIPSDIEKYQTTEDVCNF